MNPLQKCRIAFSSSSSQLSSALPMTKSQRSKRLIKSTQSYNPTSKIENSSKLSVNIRSKSKSPLKIKPPISPERPISNNFDLDYNNLRLLGRDFCSIDALDLAPSLLGKFLRRDDVILQITEVEAYRSNDSACHARVGVTARTAPMFGPGGHAYVYLCYGMHMMLNIVSDTEGVGAAVLIRSCSPVSGLTTIQQRRGQVTNKPVLLTGPGKVGQALGLSTEWSNHPLYEPGGLELLEGPKPENILVGPRVGIDYALPEHVNAKIPRHACWPVYRPDTDTDTDTDTGYVSDTAHPDTTLGHVPYFAGKWTVYYACQMCFVVT